MKSIIITAVVFLLLFISNPSMQKHKDSINEKCKQLNPITGAIGGCALFSRLGCEYHNCYVFSYTQSKGELVSVGVLGIAFVIKNLDI